MSEIKPATDERIEALREYAQVGGSAYCDDTLAVLARLDAERARAEKAVRELEVGLDMMMDVRLKLHTAEAKLAKAREALRQAYDDVPGWVDLARAALDDTGGGER